MNARYPDATADEVAREDVCIICREDMRPWRQPPEQAGQPAGTAGAAGANAANATPIDERLRPKKLPCGHILHFACLRSWLERQQNCPTCRRPVLIPSTLSRPQGANPLNQDARAQINPEQPQGPGAGQGEAQQPVMAQNVFQFGPFRLVFGARQAGQGFAQQGDIQPAQPNHQAPVPAIGDFQRLGNAFGFLRQAPANQRATANFSPTNVPVQLHHIEQQLMREINGLRVQADQLFLVRALQGELARLRIAQANPEVSMSIGTATINQHWPQNPMVQGPQPLSAAQIFSSNQQQQAISSGHRELPPGVTIPDGWTILPLQRLPNGANTGGSTADLAHPFHSNPQASIGGETLQPAASYLADSQSSQRASEHHNLQAINGVGDEGPPNIVAASPRGNTLQSSHRSPPSESITPTGVERTAGAQTCRSSGHERPQVTPRVPTSNPQGLSEDVQPHILPVWGSDSRRSNGDQGADHNNDSRAAKSAGSESPSHQAAQASTPAAEIPQVRGKGKGKAATVEDEGDDMK